MATVKPIPFITMLTEGKSTTDQCVEAIEQLMATPEATHLMELLAFMKVHGAGVEEFIAHCTYWYDEADRRGTILYAARCISGELSPFTD